MAERPFQHWRFNYLCFSGFSVEVIGTSMSSVCPIRGHDSTSLLTTHKPTSDVIAVTVMYVPVRHLDPWLVFCMGIELGLTTSAALDEPKRRATNSLELTMLLSVDCSLRSILCKIENQPLSLLFIYVGDFDLSFVLRRPCNQRPVLPANPQYRKIW
jgi:hypothetical protein